MTIHQFILHYWFLFTSNYLFIFLGIFDPLIPCDYIRLIILKQKKCNGVEEDTITCSCFENFAKKHLPKAEPMCKNVLFTRKILWLIGESPQTKTDFITTSFCKKSLLKLDMTLLSIDL